MNILRTFFIWLLLAATARAQPLQLAVTTTLLETAARDLLGGDVEVIRILPPGSCPGHFDLEPGQVIRLASAPLFLRHDFQAQLDAGLARAGLDAQRVQGIPSQPAFTIPSAYLLLCEELAPRLIQQWPGQEPAIRQRLEGLRGKAALVEGDIRQRAQPHQGKKILCARYQKEFCEWVGLEAVATYNAGTDESAWLMSRAVDMGKTAGATAVIGNQQWGPRHLEALTEATGLPGIMLSNFPDSGEAGAYWALVEQNIQALETGLP